MAFDRGERKLALAAPMAGVGLLAACGGGGANGDGAYGSTASASAPGPAMLAIFILMPMVFLSGAWTPPEAMPAGLRKAMGLTLPGVAIFGFGVRRFRRQFG